MIAYDGGQLTKPYDSDAGYDLRAMKDFVILPGERLRVPTGIKVNMSLEGVEVFGMVTGRSGMTEDGILCLTGIIDNGYQGDIGVMLWNTTQKPYAIKGGERIAQIIFCSRVVTNLKKVPIISWAKSKRGSKGFGSSGN